MIENIIITAITAIAGAIATVWGYWTGRKRQASDNAQKRSEAIHDLNETIDQQGARINDLYEVVLALKSENYKLSTQNEELLANQRSLLEEIEGLRRELAIYKRPAPTKRTVVPKARKAEPAK